MKNGIILFRTLRLLMLSVVVHIMCIFIIRHYYYIDHVLIDMTYKIIFGPEEIENDFRVKRQIY